MSNVPIKGLFNFIFVEKAFNILMCILSYASLFYYNSFLFDLTSVDIQ